jgi:RES domain-containing protein
MLVNPESLAALKTEPFQGKVFRYIRRRFAEEPLSTKGSLDNGGRYNVAGQFGVLYLGFQKKFVKRKLVKVF